MGSHRRLGIGGVQVYAIGTSNGGSLTVRAACSSPDLFLAVAPEIGSLEARDTGACASKCQPPVGGYEECAWDHTLKGCSHKEWALQQPMIYDCKGVTFLPFSYQFDRRCWDVGWDRLLVAACLALAINQFSSVHV